MLADGGADAVESTADNEQQGSQRGAPVLNHCRIACNDSFVLETPPDTSVSSLGVCESFHLHTAHRTKAYSDAVFAIAGTAMVIPLTSLDASDIVDVRREKV